ncbi:glycogenin glucosyltransferase [Apiospora marii]|uniref:glycogenin glucosyltransferase n=1 Tax=Apiospora marii TaxID=335849 RepID=UPI00312CC5FB
MAAQGGAEEDVYLTLLMNDTYLPGALVLGHSLRDGGTSKKLGAMVTMDTVAAEAITQLQASLTNSNAVYDYIIPVPRIQNPNPSNLSLMNRTDLHSAFTKINLWKQTSFRKIVYIDADVVAYRAPDELFDIAHPFSAAPDIGWPDLFNTGVMVLTPNLGDYYALMAMAERGISFDGADQGLLNMHFKNNSNRISFSYNVTPSAHYQYVPAYRHFQSSINMVHFIGSDKPWFQGRNAATGSGVFDEMTGRWWAVYDRHYRAETSESGVQFVQYLTKGEYQPRARQGESGEQNNDRSHHHHVESRSEAATAQPTEHELHSSRPSFDISLKGPEAEASKEQDQEHKKPPPITYSGWDAQRQPPPADTRPEAANFPAMVYEMSRDTAPFVPPERYPSPPKNMYYEIPRDRPTPHYVKPKAIFPWEINQEAPTRVFAEDAVRQEAGSSSAPTSEPPASSSSEDQTLAESLVTENSPTRPKEEPATPTTPTLSVTSSDPWSSFTRTNAWDEVPEIERYVGTLQKHRRSLSLKSPGNIGMPRRSGEVLESERVQRGLKLTDFPSETERPSLPVTPAPVRRPSFWGGGGGPGVHDDDDEETHLPAAEGVPEQRDWVCVHGRQYEPADCLCDLTNVLRYHKDPAAQLQKLAKQQSDMLLQRLGSSGSTSGRRDSNDLPPRDVPFGSEELTSPTYVAQTAKVLSPQPVKGLVSEEEATPRTSATRSAAAPPPKDIPEPSYSGPGAAFEKGENISRQETAMPPSEEELGVLQT